MTCFLLVKMATLKQKTITSMTAAVATIAIEAAIAKVTGSKPKKRLVV